MNDFRFAVLSAASPAASHAALGRVRILRLLAIPFLLMVAVSAPSQTIAAPFDANYSFSDLGSVPGVPSNYGGLTISPGDPNTLIIGGAANTAAGALYSIEVVRDTEGHITGFNGTAAVFAMAAFNDGGVVIGPSNVIFLARWPSNELGQLKPGSTATDKIIDMAPFGVVSSLAALNFVPPGFPGAGQLKMVSWSSGNWYTAGFAPDGTGTFDITSVTSDTQISGGPEGFIYIPPGSPSFTDFTNLLVAEYSAGTISTYEVDGTGNPVPATRVPFMTGLSGAEGALIDPVTGDFLFSTFGGGSRVIVVQGFAVPTCEGSADNYGTGLAGAGGLVPEISLMDCPSPGLTVTLEISNGRGGAAGCVAFGMSTNDAPIVGGTMLVNPSVVVPHVLDGTLGMAGEGSTGFVLLVPPDPSLVGRHFYFQSGYLDDEAPLGVSLTDGLDVTIG